MAQRDKIRSEEKSKARAEKKAEKKAENEKLYQEVMSDYFEEAPSAPEKPKGKNKLVKRIGIILFVLLNAAVIYFTASSEFSKKAPPPIKFSFTNILFLLGGILCLIVVLGSETLKYMIMMRHLGEKVSFRHAFSTAALGKYYDCITPSGAGGQPFQIYYLHSQGYSGGAASAMPLSGFFTMQFGFVILCLFAFIFGNSAMNATGQTGIKITAYFGAIAYTVVPVMIIISGVAPKIAMRIVAFFVRIGAALHIVKKPNHTIMKSVRSLNNYSVNIKRITKDKGLLTKLLILSTIFQLAMCSMPFFAVRTFDGDLNYFDALFMCIFIQAAISLIPTPGNAGAAEGSFYIVFSSLGTAGTFWAMLIWRFLCYYSFIVIGVLIYGFNAVVRLRENHRAKKLSQEAE
ncbi:MAG: flippase-like domain-containing protein [Ruminococcus sp.]|uniref:lysylphosphatidylglycerol synthase transmembrane domain-containing protein n=1 Tax=Ruminococcus sp. TaxID=41978 RepID=UPI00386AEBEB|nr:flippase-like domain-containing protein [Ruminococcus sp.]